MSSFKISKQWIAKRPPVSELEATLARVKILVDGKNVTEFRDENADTFEQLEIPVYYLAEWLAENWWPLLFEPRKNEEVVDETYVYRHSLLSAQHGFALPQINFVPTGRTIRITVTARLAQLADVKFRNSAAAELSREDVASALAQFVGDVCDQLCKSTITNTDLQTAWQQVVSVSPEEQQFCEFAGALGLNPDEVSDSVAILLERLSDKFGGRLLRDLCLVAPANSFESIAGAAEYAFDGLNKVTSANLEPVLSLPIPSDNFSVPAWRRGVNAAGRVRTALGIKETDLGGATRVFEELALRTERLGEGNLSNEVSLTGAVKRNQNETFVTLLQPGLPQRRFAAARAVFAAWTMAPVESRFLTSAVTREQQASRAFAAELTAPKAVLRARAKNGRLNQDQVFQLADELQVGPDVVSKQALNNGLQVR